MSNSGLIVKNKNSEEAIILKLKDVNTIGRGKDNDFILPSKPNIASLNHLNIEKIKIEDTGEYVFWLIDHSTHGTEVNNKIYRTRSVELKDGTYFKIGGYDYSFTFCKKIRPAEGTAERHDIQNIIQENKLNKEYIFMHDKVKDFCNNEINVIKGDIPILLTGETGTGKTLLAEHINKLSGREPFITVSAPNLTDTLLEDTLFGHVRGAYTTATGPRKGAFIKADGGTLFIDEIGSISEHIQSKLLTVISEKKFYPVGSDKPVKVNVRIITASNQPLKEKLIDALYRRIYGLKLELPPLREISSSIKQLANILLNKYAKKYGESFKVTLSPDAVQMLEEYHWPYNIADLDRMMHYLTCRYRGKLVTSDDLADRNDLFEMKDTSETKLDENITVKEYEKRKIIIALDKCSGNKEKASKLTGIPRSTLYRKIKDYDIVT